MESKSEEPRGGHKDGGRTQGVGRASLPCGAPVTPPTYFFILYIHIYSKTLRSIHENTFPPPQPFVPVRSHLGAFFGVLSEGDSIMEGLYINTIALPLNRE